MICKRRMDRDKERGKGNGVYYDLSIAKYKL